jgi:hypothetical protein
MTGQMTDPEMKAKYLQVMGPNLGLLFHELEIEAWRLRSNRSEFHELSNRSDERLELLNRIASNFLARIQAMLVESAMMLLCFLTDRQKSALSFRRLPSAMPDASLKAEAALKVAQLANDCECRCGWLKPRQLQNHFQNRHAQRKRS